MHALADRLQQQDLHLQWLRRDADLRLRADAELLALALANLLGNALDFAPPGSTLELSVHAEAGGQAVFALRDHGPGVPAAALPQLGQRFFSTARPGSLRKGLVWAWPSCAAWPSCMAAVWTSSPPRRACACA